jgi:hypothetical protein
MAKKKNQKPKIKTEQTEADLPVDALLREEARYLEEKNYRKLIFIARLLVRKGAPGDTAVRLERYHLHRALELSRKGMAPKGILLLDGVKTPYTALIGRDLYRELLTLLLRGRRFEAMAGFIQEAQTGEKTPRGISEVTPDAMLADCTVLDSGCASFFREKELFAHDMAIVTESFSLLSKGDLRTALEQLARLPLHSPFRFWKLFLKGVTAFLESKDEEAAAYLVKIPPECAAAEAARSVLTFLSPGKEPQEGALLDIGTCSHMLWNALEPERSVIETEVWEIELALQEGKLDRALAMADRLTGSPAFSEQEKIEFAALLWTMLARVKGSIPREPLKKYPHLTPYIPDTPGLDRLKAREALARNDYRSAEHRLLDFAAYLRKQQSLAWLDSGIRNEACAIVFHEAVKTRRLQAQWNQEVYHNRALYCKADLAMIEKTLEQAVGLYPALKRLYLEMLDVLDQVEGGASKRGKWLQRLSKAFPDDCDAKIQALKADITSGALERARKTMLSLAAQGDRFDLVHPDLYECAILLARGLSRKISYDDMVALHELIIAKTEGMVRAASEIKYACYKIAAGKKQEGEEHLSLLIEQYSHREIALLIAVAELKRLGAGQGIIEAWRSRLRRLIQSGSLTSPLPLLQLHLSQLVRYPYPQAKQDVTLVTGAFEQFEKKDLSEEEMDMALHYFLFLLESRLPFPTSILRDLIRKAAAAFPGNAKFQYINFVHGECGGKPRALTEAENSLLGGWIESLRQRGDPETAASMTNFQNHCRLLEEQEERRAPLYDDEDEDENEELESTFEAIMGGAGSDLPFTGPAPRRRGKSHDAGHESPGAANLLDFFSSGDPGLRDEMEMMLSFMASMLPRPSSPHFDREARALMKQMGFPWNREVLMLLKMYKGALEAGSKGKKREPKSPATKKPGNPAERREKGSKKSLETADKRDKNPGAHQGGAGEKKPPAQTMYEQLEIF